MADAKATFRLEGEDATAGAFRSALGNVQEFSERATMLLKGAFGFEVVNIFAEQIKGIAELGDGLVKGAERAGIAQAQFNQLAAAFGEADVSVQSLSKGLKNMEVAIAKAAGGDTSLVKAFNEIGLSAESLKHLAPDVELLAIAEALSKIEDPADRAHIGTQILGKAFLELEPILAKGAAGLDEMVQAANGMDEETSKKLAVFNEQLNHLWANVKLFAAGGTAGIANFFTGLKDTFSPELATRIKQIQDALGNSGNYDESRLAQMRTELAALQAQADAFTKPNANVEAALDEQGKGRAEKFANEFEKAVGEIMKAQEAADKVHQAALDAAEKSTRTTGERRLDYERQVLSLLNVDKDGQLHDGTIKLADAFGRLNAQSDTAASKSFMTQNQTAIATSIKESTDSVRESYKAMSEDARIAGENNRRMFEQSGLFAQEAGRAIQSSFAQAFLSIGQGGLKGLVANFVHAFATIVANAEAMDLAKAMGLQDALSHQGGGSALGGIFSGLKSLFSGSGGGADSFTPYTTSTAGLLGYAGGGSFNVGGSGGTDSQVVAFRATPGEQVSIKTPGQQGGGVTVINNNYIDSRTDSTQIAQMIKASTQQAVQQSTAQMTQLIKRGAFA